MRAFQEDRIVRNQGMRAFQKDRIVKNHGMRTFQMEGAVLALQLGGVQQFL